MSESIGEEAGRVTDEARAQGRELIDRTQERLKEEARHQTDRAAHGLRSVSDELRAMAEGSDRQDGQMAGLVRRGADGIDAFADRLDRQGIEGVLGDVGELARRRPAAFLITTFGAGVLLGRLMKNIDTQRVAQGPERVSSSQPHRDEGRAELRSGAVADDYVGTRTGP